MPLHNKNSLSEADIRAILRAADEIITRGGRTLLAKILKGSREKKVVEYGLEQCPTYGYVEKPSMRWNQTLRSIKK